MYESGACPRATGAQDVHDPALDLTYIVLETLGQEVVLRDAVLENVPAQSESGVQRAGLKIVEMTAEA